MMISTERGKGGKGRKALLALCHLQFLKLGFESEKSCVQEPGNSEKISDREEKIISVEFISLLWASVTTKDLTFS